MLMIIDDNHNNYALFFVRLGSEEFEDTFSYSGMYLILINVDGEEGRTFNLAAN